MGATNVSQNGTNSESPHYEIPKTCKAGVVVNEGPDFSVEIAEVPVPSPGPDEILVKINVTGLCALDIHYMMNDLQMPKMSEFGVRSPGHEGAGVVVQLGANVQKLKLGDRVGVKPVWDTCGACDLCWDDKETYCDGMKLTGLVTNGTYQQYIVIPEKYTTRIPDGVSDEVAAPIMCSASTVYRSLVESQLRPGDWAVFPGGGGGVGIQGVQLAKAMGFRPIAIDSGSQKRDLCLNLGAEEFIDFREVKDVAAEVVRITDGKGAHGVFVTAIQAYKDAPAFLGTRVGPKIMCIGLPPPGTMFLGADPSAYCFRNMTISGTLVGSMKDTAKALDFARRGMLKPIYEKLPLEKLPEAVKSLKKGQVAGRIVIDFNE